jgi:putative ABC transport system substrate-binding protein
MNAKIATLVFVFLVFLSAHVAGAQQPGKIIPRIGYLMQQSAPAGSPSRLLEAFLEGLRELGYVEGKNVAIEYRYTEGKNERLPELVAELTRLKVDIIVVETDMAALQAKKATQTIPIVMTGSSDPVSEGLVSSLAHPGGNVTGLTSLSPATIGKRLQLLAEVVPNLTNVGVLWDGVSSPLSDREWAEMRAAAQQLKVQLYSLKASGPAEFPRAFAEAVRQQVQAIFPFDTWAIHVAAAQIAELAIQNRLPMVSFYMSFPRQGGLMSYGWNPLESFRRAATYIDRILKGAKPADLPVGQPTKFVLWINLKTAKALGLTIPQSVLSQAERVFE